FPFMSVVENLLLGAHTARARAERASTLEYVYSLFPALADRRTQLAGSLSGGEQQMCAIGRALMARPRVLMLDEPTLGLAPVLVARIFETVRAINADGVTVLLVEQNVRQALTLAHRACVLESGKLVLEGRARELLGDERLKRACTWMVARMREAGLRVTMDQMGNIFGERPGAEPLPPVLIGSHVDSVPTGGKYDGQLGVLCGLETIRTLNDHRIRTRHPVAL